MQDLTRALESFVDYIGSIGWAALGIAVLCHIAKSLARTRAWRNIIAAAYPDADVPWRSVYGAYLAGVGVNAVLPTRGGDLLKLYLVHRRVEGATYPTLAATLLVETIFDFVASSLLLLWALQRGVLPGIDVLPTLPAIDWFWIFERPRLAAVVAVIVLVLGFAFGLWAGARFAAFRKRVAQGFAVLRPRRLYLTSVVPWQALDWLLRLVGIYFFLRAFRLDATVANVLLVQVAQSLSTILPLTPAGIGTEQALLVYLLSGGGSEPAAAVLSFSVGMKVVLIAVNVTLGLVAILIMLRTFRWRGIVHRHAAEAQSGSDA
jgi:glycosyltransferase 2 family protein